VICTSETFFIKASIIIQSSFMQYAHFGQYAASIQEGGKQSASTASPVLLSCESNRQNKRANGNPR
jgi:hypothetical protein